ncbi:MAG: alpha-glucosidase [Salinispira sp.]
MSVKIVLVGAGSSNFGTGTIGDIFGNNTLRGAHVCLHDIHEGRLSKMRAKAEDAIEEYKLNFSLSATLNRREAFSDADFIIISIEVGDRFKLWEEDWRIPQQYGIQQVYGENGGAGGLFHALRIIPPILEICRDAIDIAPHAHFFCYSNPMTAITTTVHRAFPGIKFTGLCHEIASLERYLPIILNKDFDELECIAGGLNHFSCLLEARDKKTNKDMYPEIMKKAYEFFRTEPGYSDIWNHYLKTKTFAFAEGSRNRAKVSSNFEWADRRLFKFIMENYGLLPITVDSHFGEYIAWAWDIADHRGILDFFDYYRISCAQWVEKKVSLECNERVVPIIEGILTDSNYLEAAVNIPNAGYIDDLPEWIAVEVPAYIRKSEIKGKHLPNIQKGFLALLRNYCGVYDLTAEAVLRGSREYAMQALLANPVINRALPLRNMLDRMIDQQQEWLAYLT